MADPEVDHGFVEDSQGRTDILRSPFFNLRLDHDQSMEDYVDRILYQLTLSIEEHIRLGCWQIVGRPPTPPMPATSPTTKIFGSFFLESLHIRDDTNDFSSCFYMFQYLQLINPQDKGNYSSKVKGNEQHDVINGSMFIILGAGPCKEALVVGGGSALNSSPTAVEVGVDFANECHRERRGCAERRGRAKSRARAGRRQDGRVHAKLACGLQDFRNPISVFRLQRLVGSAPLRDLKPSLVSSMGIGAVNAVVNGITDKVNTEGDEGDAKAGCGVPELVDQHRMLPPFIPPFKEFTSRP
ncbi:hypothetical protein M5K25_022645 [Dendrobium thyrsiflorum]|uniref:Uncharacterized protein n=1 Tax=Dendrobium thyrsiflorum TaxID=117978 RepID=A0ABD0UCU1_DENTH